MPKKIECWQPSLSAFPNSNRNKSYLSPRKKHFFSLSVQIESAKIKRHETVEYCMSWFVSDWRRLTTWNKIVQQFYPINFSAYCTTNSIHLVGIVVETQYSYIFFAVEFAIADNKIVQITLSFYTRYYDVFHTEKALHANEKWKNSNL